MVDVLDNDGNRFAILHLYDTDEDVYEIEILKDRLSRIDLVILNMEVRNVEERSLIEMRPDSV